MSLAQHQADFAHSFDRTDPDLQANPSNVRASALERGAVFALVPSARWLEIGGVAAIALLCAVLLTHQKAPSLDRLADRVERAQVLPEATRQELQRVLDRTAKAPRLAGVPDHNAAAAARIERAMQQKPATRNP